jgi:hypothetical protein
MPVEQDAPQPEQPEPQQGAQIARELTSQTPPTGETGQTTERSTPTELQVMEASQRVGRSYEAVNAEITSSMQTEGHVTDRTIWRILDRFAGEQAQDERRLAAIMLVGRPEISDDTKHALLKLAGQLEAQR